MTGHVLWPVKIKPCGHVGKSKVGVVGRSQAWVSGETVDSFYFRLGVFFGLPDRLLLFFPFPFCLFPFPFDLPLDLSLLVPAAWPLSLFVFFFCEARRWPLGGTFL